jgi:hypothetical protein
VQGSVAGIPCVSGDIVGELSRGVRKHFSHFVKQLEEHTWRDAQRGLAHSYSRAKVKFNVNRVDNMIIQVCAASLYPCCWYNSGPLSTAADWMLEAAVHACMHACMLT